MRNRLHLFEGIGIELEYMIVKKDSLDIFPIADKLIHSMCGDYSEEIEVEPLAWSNEMLLHVIEFKTNGPARYLNDLPGYFQESVNIANKALARFDARLMPAAMHPWMNPFKEAVLWPHGYSTIYETYNRIFDCRGHGWSNLQSIHMNLPFQGDEEFGRLHAAIRLLLPIIPALAASSPLVDGKQSGWLDYRLETYRNNSKRIPSITGKVIPEQVFNRDDYGKLLRRLYDDIAPHDPDGVLQHEWLNSRGAIARFERDTIEIRIIDTQECPAADIGIAALIVEVLKALSAEKWCSCEEQRSWSVDPLEKIFLGCIKDAGSNLIDDPGYLRVFGMHDSGSCTTRDLWRHILETLSGELHSDIQRLLPPVKTILQKGTLAERILDAIGPEPDKGDLVSVYSRLCSCLEEGKMFLE